MGEAKRKRVAFQTGDAGDLGWGSGGVTVVGAVYSGATFSARVQVQDVVPALREAENVLVAYKAARTKYLDAKDWVATMLLKGEHMTENGGYVLASTLLWCFCVGSPGATMFKEMARQGGHTMVFEITGEIPGTVNFRTLVTETDVHPLAHLFPDPRDMTTMGNA
jgi:hypothetical protein